MTGSPISTKERYRTVDVPVRGGDLRLGVWEPVDGADDDPAPTVVAVHGVTASHRCWSTVAERLPEMRVIAPDLRGRGRSRDLPGPYGMAQHAADVAAALDHLELDSAGFVGHSMGAFMVVAMSALQPDRVGPVVLVDGGLPLPVPEGLTPDQVTTAILGPAKQRLSMTFPDRETYRDFFRAHPAFAGEWSDAVADYVDYDLVGEPPELQAATRYRGDGGGLGGPAARRGLAAAGPCRTCHRGRRSCGPRAACSAPNPACTRRTGRRSGSSSCRMSTSGTLLASTTTRSCSATPALPPCWRPSGPGSGDRRSRDPSGERPDQGIADMQI